jgi:hypothetical protein
VSDLTRHESVVTKHPKWAASALPEP